MCTETLLGEGLNPSEDFELRPLIHGEQLKMFGHHSDNLKVMF